MKITTQIFFLIVAVGAGYVCGRRFPSAPDPLGMFSGPSSQRSRVAPPSTATRPKADEAGSARWCREWLEASRQSHTPQTEAELTKKFALWAETDPEFAARLALKEPNLRLRALLLESVLRGWGHSAPDSAVGWLLTQSVLDRGRGAHALLCGMADQPADAVIVAKILVDAEPVNKQQYGHDLISALCDTGSFSAAADFAAGGSGEIGTAWLSEAFGTWAAFQSQTAVARAQQLPEEESRHTAMLAALSGWAATEPRALLDYALQKLPPGEMQSHALTEALRNWATDDVAAASEWIRQNGSRAEFDKGKAAVATRDDVLRTPGVAAGWAMSITDPALRSHTLDTVVRQWARADLAGAVTFVQGNPQLAAEEQTALLSAISPPTNL